MKLLANRIRWVVVVALSTALALFAYQNAAELEVRFLVWGFEARRAYVIAASVVLGAIIGWLAARARRK